MAVVEFLIMSQAVTVTDVYTEDKRNETTKDYNLPDRSHQTDCRFLIL